MKIKLLTVFAVLLFAACSGSSNKEEKAIIEKEIIVNDSIALEMEKATTDLQESMNKVDSLINEL